MSLKTQAKVLRVLQEQTMEPVGGTKRIRVDARVAGGHEQGSAGGDHAPGRFREDLYFRLNVIPIFVPPLRERQEDIPLLADHFMAEFAQEYRPAAQAARRGRHRRCSATPGRATSASCAT